jgi:hypothetical protein
MTLDEQFLNESEAWAWLSTFQLALRSTAVANGLVDQERLESCDAQLLEFVRTLQQFLFSLAECL